VAVKLDRVSAVEQLAALARTHALLTEHGLDYWLFGGWAVDFHASIVSRPHDDLDIAVWASDYDRIASLLLADGWDHRPEEGDDGYTSYERDGVRLEVAFLARDEHGQIYTPLREARASWPEGAFGRDVRQLLGVRAKVIGLEALRAEKAEIRGDPSVAAKDRADSQTLSRKQ
jgi:Aminoglycoside-2''-adenylyltransferase